jgi:hypothetical protein
MLFRSSGGRGPGDMREGRLRIRRRGRVRKPARPEQPKPPRVQEKLRALKEKRNWSHDDFIEAKPFVRDEKTAVYDQTTDELLSAIASMGQEGAAAAAPDCALMLELRARMKLLVDTQSAKWSYMFQKLDGELAK